MFGIAAFSQAPFSSLAGAVLLGQASVTADATVVSTAVRLRTSSGDISSTATITTDGLLILNGVGNINAASAVTIDATRLRTVSGAVNATASASVTYLRIRTNRFKEGLEKTSDLLQSETQYSQKQLEHYQTIFEYNYALAYLQFLTKD